MTSMHEAGRRFDRHLGISADLSGESETVVINKFVGPRVLLTGHRDRLTTVAGQHMFLLAANLIARFCPKIDLLVPPELARVGAQTLTLLAAIDRSPHAEFRVVERPEHTYAAVLSIGVLARPTLVTTIIDANGWLALVSRSNALPAVGRPADENPFGALMAAALGAAEVFKDLLQPLPGKAFHFGTATFSTFDYSVNMTDTGPVIPRDISLPPCLLAGVGAVGNAFLLSLSCLGGVRGDLFAVDKESVDDLSNLSRYVLAVEADAIAEHPTPKTTLATRLFAGSMVHVQPFQEPIEKLLERIYQRELPRPEIVLSAVDNNDARGLLQKLWPTLLLEGATDRTISQVSRHEYGRSLACLLCIHTIGSRELGDFSYLTHSADLSGLSEEAIAASHRNVSLVLTAEHIERAPEPKREVLAAHLGKPICSVLAELERLSTRAPDQLPPQPAVSFVSMISGLLMAAELIKYATGLGSSLETFFQMDSLFPLSNAFLQPVEAVSKCYCVVRRDEIRRYREAAS